MTSGRVADDVLGPAYTARELALRPDDEGEVVATLVSRPAAESTTRAVLYVHGWADYFFQDHLARFWVDEGYDFYALDLRKYGRSLRPHQTPNFCRDLREYDEELDETARIVQTEDGHDVLVVMGHSTGGLIASLWANRRPGVVDGLVLNSPWFDLNRPWVQRTVVSRGVVQLGTRRPMLVLEPTQPPHYGLSIHRSHRGEWEYDLGWKPLGNFPVRAGWIRAIRVGHTELVRGLDIDCPVLVACSTRSVSPRRWNENVRRADAVLNVDQIVRRAPLLGRLVTVTRVPDGVHDLSLSSPEPRERFFAEVRRWCRAYVLAGNG